MNINLRKTWVLLFCIILVSLPRFNRNQLIFKRPQADMEIHTAMVKYYNTGNIDEIILSKNSIAANWRPLFPFLASLIPFNAITSLSILGIFSIFISVIFIKKILNILSLPKSIIYQSLYIFIFSFPVFYYTTIGYVDPGLIMMISIGIYLTITNQLILLMITILFGVFMKEGIIVLIPFLSFYIYKLNYKYKKIIFWLFISSIFYITASVIVRKTAINASETYQLFWEPSFKMIKYNFNRDNSWLSFILVLGIPFGIIARNLSSFKFLLKENRFVLPLFTGVITAISMYFFSFISTVADGRTLWASYPFIIPIIGLVLNEER